MTTKTTPAPPDDLSPEAARLWPGLVRDLGAVSGGAPAEVELLTLGDLLRVRDRLAAVGEKLAADGVTTAGSTGQVQRSPLLAEERALRAEWVAGLERLGLRVGYFGVSTTPSGRLKRAKR